MAEGDAGTYNNFKEQVLLGNYNLGSGGNTIKVALMSGYTPNIDTHQVWSDISASQASGAGYTAGGATLGSQTVTQDNTNDRGVFDGADVTYTGLNVGTPSHAVMYKDTGTGSTSLLMFYWELGRPSNGGDYTLVWNAVGIATIT